MFDIKHCDEWSYFRGFVKLKKIKKSEKNSNWPDPKHPPPPIHFFFLNLKHVQRHKTTQKIQKL